ncbi:GTPase, partial [Bifidobacterium breve]|nr:GTPase [Bifidobacterium breve]
PYERITGLSNWSTLSYAEQGAQGEANTSGADVAFKDSNMWKEVNCGAGKASLDLKDAAGTDVVLADFGQKVSD